MSFSGCLPNPLPVRPEARELHLICDLLAYMTEEERIEAFRSNFEVKMEPVAFIAQKPEMCKDYPLPFSTDIMEARRRYSIFTARINVNYNVLTCNFIADARIVDCGRMLMPQASKASFHKSVEAGVRINEAILSVFGFSGPTRIRLCDIELCSARDEDEDEDGLSRVATPHFSIPRELHEDLWLHVEGLCRYIDVLYGNEVAGRQEGFSLQELVYIASMVKNTLPPGWECDENELIRGPPGY